MDASIVTVVSITLNIALVFFYTISIVPLRRDLQRITETMHKLEVSMHRQYADHEARIRTCEQNATEAQQAIGRIHSRVDFHINGKQEVPKN